MKLDKELAGEIKREANGDCSRAARFDFMKRVDRAAKALSSPDVARGGFEATMKEHGRVPVTICVAATLWDRRERLDRWGIQWAQAVLNLWENRPPSGADRAIIHDSALHPTRICEYAGSFIRLPAEEG